MSIIFEDVRLPGHREQRDNLILFLGDNLKSPEEMIEIKHNLFATRIGARGEAGVKYTLGYLKEKKIVHTGNKTEKLPKGGTRLFDACGLTHEGWDKYEQLKRSGTAARIAFMAMQYNDPSHDEVFQKCLKPAVKETGFELRRLDEHLPAGLIDNHLRVQIRNSRFLLADLTNQNRGAYWEAGYAEGLGKPVIYLCEKKQFDEFKTHFDTNHHTTVTWDESDLVSAAEALKSTIRATLPLVAKMTDEKS